MEERISTIMEERILEATAATTAKITNRQLSAIVNADDSSVNEAIITRADKAKWMAFAWKLFAAICGEQTSNEAADVNNTPTLNVTIGVPAMLSIMSVIAANDVASPELTRRVVDKMFEANPKRPILRNGIISTLGRYAELWETKITVSV